MPKKSTINVRPWCPFCGQDVGRPQEPAQRKMDEFTAGTCQCGAVYTCDPTGYNVGAAMVECLVHACDDNWDLAWELMPDDDYISGRLDRYDEQTHQIIEMGNLDGRKVRGVLYFIRISKDFAELSGRLDSHKKKVDSSLVKQKGIAPDTPEMEPIRDPKRQKKKAQKKQVRELVEAQDIDQLVDLAFDDIKTLRFMQRLLYDPEEDKRWLYAHLMGQVCRRLSTRKPGAVSDLLHRMYESCTDSASTHWGLLEAIGSIIAARTDIFGAFARHILMFRGTESSKSQVLWAMGIIAKKRPDIVRSTPFYSLFPFLQDTDDTARAYAVKLFGRINADEVRREIEGLVNDPAEIKIYEDGLPQQITVGELAREAISNMDNFKEGPND